MQLIEAIGNPKYLEDSLIIDLIVGMSSSDIFMKMYFEGFLDYLERNNKVWEDHLKAEKKLTIFKIEKVLKTAK
jgi:hypothetical protein